MSLWGFLQLFLSDIIHDSSHRHYHPNSLLCYCLNNIIAYFSHPVTRVWSTFWHWLVGNAKFVNNDFISFRWLLFSNMLVVSFSLPLLDRSKLIESRKIFILFVTFMKGFEQILMIWLCLTSFSVNKTWPVFEVLYLVNDSEVY